MGYTHKTVPFMLKIMLDQRMEWCTPILRRNLTCYERDLENHMNHISLGSRAVAKQPGIWVRDRFGFPPEEAAVGLSCVGRGILGIGRKITGASSHCDVHHRAPPCLICSCWKLPDHEPPTCQVEDMEHEITLEASADI